MFRAAAPQVQIQQTIRYGVVGSGRRSVGAE
ncbi:hypothetical protein CHELA40_10873 [Chelatococcus asaccharovorans]|nr:hypothetical protein CHELA40_10873 [Chelatococcus asaccharovorans]CAH1685879.1 hypothetical protein CHELA17_64727 [Chelatococcus asaccharovorans]